MPEVIMRPNAKFYVPSPEEIYKPIQDTLLEKLGRNRRFIRHVEGKAADANGLFRIEVSPPTGFIWSLRWLQWSGTAGSNMSMYINEVSPVNLIGINFVMGTSAQTFPSETYVIKPADKLVMVQGSTVQSAAQQVSVQVGCIEVPFAHEAQLI